MQPKRKIAETVDEYIGWFPEGVQDRLNQIRKLVKEISPEAIETISYAIPAYKVGAVPLIYFSAFEKHIGMYPLPQDPTPDLAKEISPYVAGKGTLRFYLDKPLPLSTIEKVIEHRQKNLSK